MAISRQNLRAFLGRPWEQLRVSKDRHTTRLAERQGAASTLRMADQLRVHVARLGAVPTAAACAADLATAVRLRRLLDRAYRRSSRTS